MGRRTNRLNLIYSVYFFIFLKKFLNHIHIQHITIYDCYSYTVYSIYFFTAFQFGELRKKQFGNSHNLHTHASVTTVLSRFISPAPDNQLLEGTWVQSLCWHMHFVHRGTDKLILTLFTLLECSRKWTWKGWILYFGRHNHIVEAFPSLSVLTSIRNCHLRSLSVLFEDQRLSWCRQSRTFSQVTSQIKGFHY